jgi:hypothetical protein
MSDPPASGKSVGLDMMLWFDAAHIKGTARVALTVKPCGFTSTADRTHTHTHTHTTAHTLNPRETQRKNLLT